MPWIDLDGPVEVYKGRTVYGTAEDERMAEAIEHKVPNSIIEITGPIIWMFGELECVIADFDAPFNPWRAFWSFWENTYKPARMVLFFTDLLRVNINAHRILIMPDGSKRDLSEYEAMAASNFWLPQHIWPWFDRFIQPYRVVERMRYTQGQMTCWGCVVEDSSED